MRLQDFSSRNEGAAGLVRDLQAGRLPQALLITGGSGIGKKTFAGLIALALFCTGEGEKPCMHCRSCKKAMDGSHPDLIRVRRGSKDKTIGVDTLRSVLDVLSRFSFQGGNRVILLEEAHLMTDNAQNCILKSLEEAPKNTYFILVSDSQNAILPTIRSRSRILRMPPLEDMEVKRILMKDRGVDEEKAGELAAVSEGSIGKALNALQSEEFWKAEKLCEDTFLKIREIKEIPQMSKKLKDSRDDADLLLEILRSRLERKLRVGDMINEKRILHVMDAIRETEELLRRYVSWQAASEQLLYVFSEEAEIWQ